MLLACALAVAAPTQDAVVRVDHDGVRITRSCKIAVGRAPIADADEDGVVRIEGDGLVVDLAGAPLTGAAGGVDPDAFHGTGIWITGKRVTLRNARVSGFH